MQKIKCEKGITLLALSITAIVLMLISTPIVVRTTKLTETKKFTDFRDDIFNLNENISSIYDFNDDISTIGPLYTGDKSFLTDGVKNPNDIKTGSEDYPYYVIDFNKLSSALRNKFNLELNNLKSENNNSNVSNVTESSSDKVFIINSNSRTIYYNKGINYGGTTHYRLQEKLSEMPIITLPASSIKLYNGVEEVENGSTIVIEMSVNEEDYRDILPTIIAKKENTIMYTFSPANDLKIDITKPGEYSKTYRAHEEGKAQATVTIKVIVK